MKIERNIPLRQFSTFKVGGNADYFCIVSSVDELKEAVDFSKQNNLPFFILGAGSNILISDEGFRGLVIKIGLKGISFDNSKVIAEAGENWDKLVEESVKKELYGIENMSFIPGTVGGAAAGNIGAYGTEIKDRVEWVEVYDIKKNKILTLNKVQCEFNYRDSIFKKNEFVIIKVCLRLLKNKKPKS